MMTENISRRDWERLSAYLDKQLSAKESAHLKTRLQTDIILLTAFKELQMTRNALKQLPHLRAPRNFTLTSEMVDVRKLYPSRWYPAFRVASMLTSLLFMLIIMGDLFSRGTLTTQPNMASPAMSSGDEVPVEESIEAEMVSDDAYSDEEVGVYEIKTTPEMVIINSTADDIVGEDTSVEKTTGDVAEELDAAMAESFAPLVDKRNTAGEEDSVEKTSEDEAEESEAPMVKSPVPRTEAENQEREIFSTAPVEPPFAEESQTDIAELDNKVEMSPPISETTGKIWLPLLKNILGVAAVVTTIITFYLRKRER